MDGQITFDTIFSEEEGTDHIEGCFRMGEQEWKVFYFTHRHQGEWWNGPPLINKDAVWQSGVTGINVVYPKNQILNKSTVFSVLSEALGVKYWFEVRGPDSLLLK